jgi:oligoribonuclease
MTEKKEKALTPAYIWFDSEFTSLEMSDCYLLQVAAVITDRKLKRLLPVTDDLNISVALPGEVEVSPWVQENIPDIVARSRAPEAVPVAEVDRRLRELVERVIGAPSDDIAKRPVLAGNSIHADLQVVRKWLPTFAATLHYRVLDVTAWKLGWVDWFEGEELDKENQDLLQKYFPEGTVVKNRAHDAYFDVCASLAEYRYYLGQLMSKVSRSVSQ